MFIEVVAPGNRRIKIERFMRARCLVCREALACPPDADPWGWARSAPVNLFLDAHRRHGAAHETGIEVHFEVED